MAFSRTDLAIIIVILAVLIVLGDSLLIRWGQNSRKAQCAGNLRALSAGATSYEKENGDRLPYAYIVYDSSSYKTWDQLILPFISPTHPGVNAYLLRCPADTIPANQQLGARRRTYAMPTHDMSDSPDDWPPGQDNLTGIGLWWAPDGWGRANLTNVVFQPTKPGFVDTPAYLLSMIRAPATTLFLTENAQSNNVAFHYFGATIDSPSQHLGSDAFEPNQYHGGKFSYLMIDGHVELLFPLQSQGRNDLIEDGSGGHYPNVWTVNPND